LQFQTMGVVKLEKFLTEALRFHHGYAEGVQSLLPESETPIGYEEGSHSHLTGTHPALPGSRPWEKGHDRSRLPGLIAEIKMIGAGIVKVDCLFHQAKSQDSSVKIHIFLRMTNNRCDMMNASGLFAHGKPPKLNKKKQLSFG